MDETDPSDNRTRLTAPEWSLDTSGSFRLDLSWDDTSYRWLEVQPDPNAPHQWRLLLREAADDSSDAAVEVLDTAITDVTALLHKVVLDPTPYDREVHR